MKEKHKTANEKQKQKKKKDKESFLIKYKWWFIISVLVMILGYIIIYLCFKWNGFLSAGKDLEKKDWLAFLGAYLAFIGTISVSIVSLLQSRYYAMQQRKLDADRRRHEIQPIFSISISQSASFGRENRFFDFEIENVSEYPIQHVIIFDTYLYQLLKPHDLQKFTIKKSDFYLSTRSDAIKVLSSEYGETGSGLPEWFNINYDDIDGHSMFQTFECKDFNGISYYSLQSIEEDKDNHNKTV